MSNQPFSFPPPPPPPPKRSTQGAFQQNSGPHNNRGSFRGGHSSRANTRGGRGGYGGGQHASFAPSGNYQRPQPRPFENGPRRGSFTNAPQKRNHTTAFPSANQPRPRPVAPPAVPSFNASIQHLLPRKEPSEPKSQSISKPRKQNLLGLTPSSQDQTSDSEDDEGEEERLAAQIKSDGQALQFEYKGHTATLRTPEEIAAWIAERKKRFPTQAKAEAAKKEAAEKRRKWEEEKQARLDAKKEAWTRREQERKEQERARAQQRQAEQLEKEGQTKQKEKALDPTALAKLQAEKLRKKALRAERQLAKAEEALRLAEAKASSSSAQSSADVGKLLGTETEALDTLSGSDMIESDFTSSSGSSGTDSDSEDGSISEEASDSDPSSAPEVVSTKKAALAADQAALPASKRPAPPLRPCKNLIKFGRCKYGSNCRFSHEKTKGSVDTEKTPRSGRAETKGTKKNDLSAGSGRRKSLWQVLVESQQEEERKRLLEAIIILGEKGMLDDPAAR
ncbi:hypothetical protein A1O3_09361 [Capronia epimyces CBS 606.96]|uniref:C3H1-type domain-containing protein n=1 Tax=Capronia epimyces CBS 606.96 TaxID=1182542 RepID=W9XLI9_9EURO|nr:uncharacterized protein A1O3_09361 [Capronia epimyces CBS 606.96]EXJ78200.1 hypothetical protein A1O3_09361 [Capronia epimyces CBS 606.96]